MEMADPNDFTPLPRASEDPNLAKGLVPVIIIPTDEAWLALAVSSMQNFFLDSIPLSILVFASTDPGPHGHIITNQQRYIAGATFFGLIYFFSPFSCALINWYSFKRISIVGPAIAVVAMVVSWWVVDLFVVFLVVLSVLGGFGCSMINMTAACLPTAWFCNKRALACRISGLCSSLGIVILSYVIRVVFLQAFDCCILLTYWVYAGIYIILLSAGFLVPKMRAILIQVMIHSLSGTRVKFTDQEIAERMAISMSFFLVQNRIFKTFHNLVFPRVKDIIKERGMFLMIPDDAALKAANPPRRARWSRMRPVLRADEASSVSFTVVGVQEVRMVIQRTLPGYGARPFYRVDIFFSADIRLLNLYYRQTNQLDFHLAATRAMTRKDYLQEVNKRCCRWPEAISRTILTMLHCGNCLYMYYVLLHLALFLYYAGYYIPFIFIKDRGLEFGIGEGDSYILMFSVGLGNVAGHLVSLGGLFCFDLQHSLCFIFTVMIQGIITFLSNVLSSIAWQMTYAIMTGLIMGVTSPMDVSIICSITGIHTLTNAIGHQLIVKGMGLTFGIMLSVQLNSAMGSVVYGFNASGVCMILASLFLLPIKKLKSMARETALDSV